MTIVIQLGESTESLPSHKRPLVQAEADEKFSMLSSAGGLANPKPPHAQGRVHGLILSLAPLVATLMRVLVRVLALVPVHSLSVAPAPSKKFVDVVCVEELASHDGKVGFEEVE